MTYATTELSVYDSQPVELFEFTFASKAWRFTSSDEEQHYLGQTYTPLAIQRSNIEQTQELNRSDLKVEVPRDADIAQEFIIYPPAEVMLLRLFRQHRGEADTVLIWIGRVLACEWKDSTATLKCEAVFTSQRRTGLRRLYQAQCPHVLYDRRCGVVQNSFRTTGTVAAVSHNVVTVAEASLQANGYFDGGILAFTDTDGIIHKRAITGHEANQITLSNSIRQLEENVSVALYPGCKHTTNDCEFKFANIVNYGGWPLSPRINPFDGKTLF